MRDQISHLHYLYKVSWGVILLSVCVLAAQPRQRIHRELGDGERFAVSGNVRPSIARAQDMGPVDSALPLSRMSIHFSMTPSQNADLLQLTRLQQTRHSAQFHKWLTPEEYGDRFGLNQKDVEKVTAWLEGQGFTNVEPARSRNLITFDGTAALAQTAFNTSIHRYLRNGVEHYANATEPELPKGLEGIVAGIRGLHDFHPRPHAHPHFTSNLSGNHYLVPNDLATIYDLKALYGNGIDGTGVKIVIPGQTDIDLSDIEAFRTAAGLTANDPQVILTGKDPGTSTNDLGEADLDIEWAGGIAKGAQVIYVNSSDTFTSATYAITNNVADVMALTYGNCEADTGSNEIGILNGVFMQATAQGITVTAASGDDGAADCDGDTTSPTAVVSIASKGLGVDYPASSPNVTGVGGTSFNEGTATYWATTNDAGGGSALSYIPEVAWNDTTSAALLSASGGGVSLFNAKPSWQVGTGVPNDNFRDTPDVSLVASPDNEEGGYLICSGGLCMNGFRQVSADSTVNGDLNVTGGTSAASPTFAGMVALLVQKTGGRQGNINQNLYTLASISTDAFHDITSGNNIVPCKGGTPNCSSLVATANGTFGYSTGTGYDQVTGLGSVDGFHLVSEWGADLQTSLGPTSLSVARGTSGTATVTVTETDYSGPVTFTCSVASPLTNTTCSIPGTVTGSGTNTLTITAGATAATPWWHHIPSGPRTWMYLFIGLMLALSAYVFSRQKKLQLVAAAFAVVLVAGLSSCGGGSSDSSGTTPNPPVVTPETGIVTVVSTSGSLTSTSTISVTVQ